MRPYSYTIISAKSIRIPQTLVDNNQKAMYTVQGCCNASGEYLPSYILYKAEFLRNSWCQNGSAGARYQRSKSGWMEVEQFLIGMWSIKKAKFTLKNS